MMVRGWGFGSFSPNYTLILLRIFHESDEISVIHERQSKHGYDLRKRNVSFYHSREHCAQEIGNEYYPGLYLDGIHALTIKKV